MHETTQNTGKLHPDYATRLDLAVSVEKCALYIGYSGLLLFGPLFWFQVLPGTRLNVILIGFCVAAHQVFKHVLLWRGRTAFFLSPTNFIIHYLIISIIVLLSTPHATEAWVLYLFLLAGVAAYTRSSRRTFAAAAICAAGYAGIVALEVLQVGFEPDFRFVGVRIAALLGFGWLVAIMTGHTRRIEDDLARQSIALAASETTLREILNHADNPILVTDAQECIVEANKRATTFLGLPREELLGQRLRSFLFDDGTLPAYLSHIRSHGEAQGELIVVTNSGEERNAEVNVRSFVFAGRPLYVSIFVDITERKNIQEAARLANTRLDRLNRALRQVDQLRTEFLNTISQRLRSPLSAVLGYIAMLLDDELGEITAPQRKALQQCRTATQHVFAFIDEALELGTLSVPEPPREEARTSVKEGGAHRG